MSEEPELLYDGIFPNLTKDWGLVEQMQRSTYALLRNWVKGPAPAQAIHLVYQELIENLMRYADWDAPHAPSIQVRVLKGPKVEIITKNTPHERGSDLKRAMDLVEKLTDPETALDFAQKRCAALFSDDPDDGNSGGLGLIRIVGESLAKLQGSVDGNGLITIHATIDPDYMVTMLKKRNEASSVQAGK